MGMGRDSRMTIVNKIEQRVAFAVASVSGMPTGYVDSASKLPEQYAQQYANAVDGGQVTYTVFSYRTPIAWVLADGTVVVPDVKYSVTTSMHQGIIRDAFEVTA